MIHQGSPLEVLRGMPGESVQVCVTSPPYFGLRSYGTEPLVFGGDPAHEHVFSRETVKTELARGNWAQDVNGRGEVQPARAGSGREMLHGAAERGFCECGAWLGHLGLEPTPELFVAHTAEIFREVRRVLKPDGVLFCNMGDSYSNVVRMGTDCDPKRGPAASGQPKGRVNGSGLKPKDLVGVPWMLAFALRADGWYLRQDIIWHKTAPMPESVRDRCTKAHEYIFLLSKSERYYFNADAIAEPAVGVTLHDATGPGYAAPGQTPHAGNRSWKDSLFHDGKNAAVHPDVGKKRSGNKARKPASERGVPVDTDGKSNGAVAGSVPWSGFTRNKRSVWTVGPQPFPEAHFATFPEEIPTLCILAGSRPGDTVLDPFNGAGTTGVVCEKLGRSYVGIELNPAYVEMANRRIANVAPLFREETA